MDDLFKNLAVGFFAFLVFHGSLEQRSQRNARQQVAQAFNSTGQVQARIAPRGVFGLLGNNIYAVDIYAKGMETDSLPFTRSHRSGWKGRIKLLRLHFSDFRLKGLPIERFEAEIPDVTYDLGHAFWRERLVLRNAGVGPSTVRIGPAGLETFLSRKFNEILSDVRVSFTSQNIHLEANARLFGLVSPLVATGQLFPREGKYVDIIHPVFQINGREVSPETAQILIQRFNPILDIEQDLGLHRYFRLSQVAVGKGALILTGNITVPLSEPPARESPPE